MIDYDRVSRNMQKLTDLTIRVLKVLDAGAETVSHTASAVSSHLPKREAVHAVSDGLSLPYALACGLVSAPFAAFSLCLFHFMRTAEGVEAYFTTQSLTLLSDAFLSQLVLFFVLLLPFIPAYIASFRHGPLREWISWLTALPMGFNMVVSLCMEHSELREIFLPASSFLLAFAVNLGAIAGFTSLVALPVSWLFYYFDHPKSKELQPYDISLERKLSVAAAVIIFIGWLPGMILCYPGTFPKDTMNQIRCYMGVLPMDTAHPIVQTLLYGWIFAQGRAYGSGDNASIFKIVLLQAIFGSIVMGIVAGRNYKYTNSKLLYGLTIAFFGFTPTWCMAAQQALKDVLHTSWHLLFYLSFLECIRKKDLSTGRIVWLCICCIFLSFTRKATFYLAVISLVVLILIKRKTAWKGLAISLAIVVVLFYGCEKGLYPALHFKKAREAENYSMQLQQVALYCREYGDELSEDEIEIINGTINYETSVSDYTPMISDPIKMTFHGSDESHEEFWELYSKMLHRHPFLFVKSLIMTTFEHFNPWYTGNFARNQLYIQPSDFHNAAYASNKNVLKMYAYWVGWSKYPVARMMCGTGLSVWALFVLTGYSIRKKSLPALLGLAPDLFLFVGMFMTHVNGLIRYGYPMIASMPLIIGYTIYATGRLETPLSPLLPDSEPHHLQWLDTFGHAEDEEGYFDT